MGTQEDMISTVIVETRPARPGRPTVEVPIEAGTTLDEVLVNLGIPADTEAVIVNGVYVRPDYRLQDGDRVVVVPFMSGG